MNFASNFAQDNQITDFFPLTEHKLYDLTMSTQNVPRFIKSLPFKKLLVRLKFVLFYIRTLKFMLF